MGSFLSLSSILEYENVLLEYPRSVLTPFTRKVAGYVRSSVCVMPDVSTDVSTIRLGSIAGTTFTSNATGLSSGASSTGRFSWQPVTQNNANSIRTKFELGISHHHSSTIYR